MLTEASRGGHLTVANLLLKQPRLLQGHHSSTRGKPSGRKSHVRNPHQQYASQPAGGKTQKPVSSTNTSITTTQPSTAHVSTSGSQESANAKNQRKTQAVSAEELGVGARSGGGAVPGRGETVGSTKRQKLSEESGGPPSKSQVSSTSGAEGNPTIPPRNIVRVGPSGSSSSNPTPSHAAETISSTTTTITTVDSTHPQQPARPTPPAGAHLTAEDVLMRCMIQMAQAQAVNATPTSTPSTAAPSNSSSASTTSAPAPATVMSPNTQHNSKRGKGPESPNSMFSRGNFASLDHISSSLSSQPPPSSSQPHPPPKCLATRGKSLTTTTVTSCTSTTSSCPPHTQPTIPATIANTDISRLIPHLEAIASSLQNTPSLESQWLALAQNHILAQHDPDVPQATELLDTIQNIPLVGGDGKQVPQSNVASIDPASLLDMSVLLQNLTSQELQGSDPPSDAHSQPVYPADFNSLKRLSQKVQAAAEVQSSDQVGESGGGGHQLEGDHLQSRPNPLTTSFLLDHNFPMDIPPPTDLLPEHVSGNSTASMMHHVHVHVQYVDTLI